MGNTRFFIADALVCLPLAVVALGGAFFYFRLLPVLENIERERVQMAYREVALHVKENEAEGIHKYDLASRKSMGRLSKGTWGIEPSNGRQLVWYRPPRADCVRGVTIEPIRPYNIRGLFGWLGGGVLLVILILTDVGLLRFRRFAKERDDFIAATTHDLRTPIAALKLLLPKDDAEARDILERLHRLVLNLSDFMRQGGQRPKPAAEPVDLVMAYRSAYRLYASEFEAEGQPIVVDLQSLPEGRLMARGDEPLIVQVLWNLIGNAHKYAASFGRVTARFSSADGMARFDLVDNGPGMSARQRRKVFDRYYRVSGARKSGKGGFGIGLCTSREIARALGGDLTVSPHSPHGCCFTLRLPAA